MGLLIKVDTDIVVDLNKIFSIENDYYTLQDSTEEGIKIQLKYDLELPDDTYDPKNYKLYIFRADDIPENSIFQVYEKDLIKSENGLGRIGWIFPLQSILSNEHDYADNIHFLRYAYVAFCKLIVSNESLCEKIPEYKADLIYSMGDFYNDSTVIMILCNELVSKIIDFQIENYLPFLYSKGYYYDKTTGICNDGKIVKKDYKNYISGSNRLILISISKDLNEGTYINRLFIDLLKNEKHYLVKFHLLYQVIELLIERIFNNEVKRLFKALEDLSCNLFEIRNEFSKLAEELGRIEKLFTIYTQNSDDLDYLKEACVNLLKRTGNFKEADNFSAGKSLYLFRSLLVHNYRLLSKDHIVMIEEINACFEKVVVSILITFTEKE